MKRDTAMKTMRRKDWKQQALRQGLLVCVLSLLFAINILAQASSGQQDSTSAATQLPHDPGSAKIMVVAKPGTNRVVLRWAPSTPHAWRLGNRIGYVVERSQAGQQPVKLTTEPVHPWYPARIEDSLKSRKNKFFMVTAMNALWGDSSFVGTTDSLGKDTIGALAARNINLYSYALFGADNDSLVAEALGLRFVDNDVKPGEQYTYRVSQTTPRDYKIEPGEVTVTVKAAVESPKPDSLSATGLDGKIKLRWVSQEKNEYTGYFVSRSDDGGKTYSLMNTTPIVPLKPMTGNVRGIGDFTDTTIVNYKHYFYHVQGIDAFGELGTSGEVEAMGRDLTPPPMPFINQPELIGNTKVKLSWTMPSDLPKDFAGFVIDRSTFSDSLYHRLTKKPLSTSNREFTVDDPSEDEPYYIISAIDTAGNEAPSFPVYAAVIDTTPPSIPTGLAGTIDTNGVVRLHWKPNPEKRILGYRVLRANAVEHEFTQVTNEVWRDTTFVDTVTMNTLTDHIYYEIAAVNNHYNHSFASAPLGLKRPDKIPPVAPVFTDVQTTESSVILSWVPSSSEDVQSHILSRRASASDSWAAIATLSPKASHYTDTAVVQNTMYEYNLEAVDSTGLHTPVEVTVQGRPFDSGIRPAPVDVKATFNDKDSVVSLTWNYTPAKQEKFYFVVFRSVGGAPLSQYQSVDSAQRTYVDKDLAVSGVYEYAIKVMTENGAESPLSEKSQLGVAVK